MVAFVEAPPLFVTLAAGSVIYGGASGSRRSGWSMRRRTRIAAVFGAGNLFGVPMPIFVFAICALVVHLFLSRTSTGRFHLLPGRQSGGRQAGGNCTRPLIILEYMIVASCLDRRLNLGRTLAAFRWRWCKAPMSSTSSSWSCSEASA